MITQRKVQTYYRKLMSDSNCIFENNTLICWVLLDYLLRVSIDIILLLHKCNHKMFLITFYNRAPHYEQNTDFFIDFKAMKSSKKFRIFFIISNRA